MPNCRDCSWLKDDHCLAAEKAKIELKRPLPPAPLGACVLPIVDAYLSQIKKGHRVLEIGCGSWGKIKDHCKNVGAQYEGIDLETEYYGVPAVATRIENLGTLSFADQSFDFVISNQSMEHWAENGCSLRWGLYQCFRVAKMGGKIFLNVPIHFHGTREFLLEELDKLAKLFSKFSASVQFEPWGKDSSPLQPYITYPEYGALKTKPAYVLDIQATKDKVTPNVSPSRFAPSGKWAQVLHYPVGFNLLRVKRRLEGKSPLGT